MLEDSNDYQVDGFFFKSMIMRQVIAVIDQVANTDETILLTGETGTGKDFLARLIHQKVLEMLTFLLKPTVLALLLHCLKVSFLAMQKARLQEQKRRD